MSASQIAPSSGSDEISATVLDHLVEHLRAKDVALEGQDRPAAILWTDPNAEWRSIIDLMQQRVEELLVLGEYAPDSRTGPAIWLRCLVDGALKEPQLPENHAPIVYLPGVARQELRAGDDCRLELRPLVDLMFRGALWLQHNGSDWGVSTFLTSTKALGLDLSRDNSTSEALLRALPEVAVTPMSQLMGRRLEAEDFDRMLSGDVIRDLLRWMGDPRGTSARLGENGWAAFCSRARDEVGFDPETEADITAGEKLGHAEGPWADVWERFVESPTSYGDIAGLLRRSRPAADEFPFDRERWPDLNDTDETEIRTALGDLGEKPHSEACEIVCGLEARNSRRREWVWTKIGLSPMAQVLEPLSRLASAVQTSLGGTNPDDVAAAYRDRGWQADASAWEAVAMAPTQDESLVSGVVRYLLQPWLDASARAFQEAVSHSPLPEAGKQPVIDVEGEACILFVDGLRFDLGQRLSERLEGRGCRVAVNHRWAALPTVTATAKPAVTPIADSITGETLPEDFAPTIERTGKPANAQNLRSEMEKRNFQILLGDTLGWPESESARGWKEEGKIDSLGHKLDARLARHINEELDRLAEHVIGLFDAGWSAVRIVTDHGWLLLPGGLPKVDLPKYLTASRWSRCAVIAGGSSPDVLRVPWHWNSSEFYATPPGIACFNKSESYSHGGLSVQECLIPDILVSRELSEAIGASITSVTWRGMRCFIEASTQGGSVTADLRLQKPKGQSVAANPKSVESDGSVSLVVTDDEHENDQLVLVLIDDEGAILAQKPTQVGVDS